MENYRQTTGSIDSVLADTVKGGDLVKIGDLHGVAVTDGDGTNLVAVQTAGVFTLPKTTAATVIAQGAKVYAASGKVNTTDTNAFLGYAWAASANGEETVDVGINMG